MCTFNKIKLGCLTQSKITYININRKNTELCNLLVSNGVLFGYRIVNVNGFKVYEAFIQQNLNFFDLKNFLRLKTHRKIKFKDVIRLCNRHTHTCYIFMTSKGIKTIPEMIRLRLGGTLMFRLK